MENKAVKDNAIRGLQSAIEISGALVHLRKEHAKAILALLKDEKEYCDKCAESAIKTTVELQEEIARLRSLLKEQEVKQYNNHEVACILADLFGDPCACNFNDIDTWLPYKCDFRETCCPNPVGVACWEQYLKHKEGR